MINIEIKHPISIVKGVPTQCTEAESASFKISSLLTTPEGSIFGCEEWGSKLHLLRHNSASKMIGEAAKLYILQAMSKNLPNIRVISITYDTTLLGKIEFQIQHLTEADETISTTFNLLT